MPNSVLYRAHTAKGLSAWCTQHQAISFGLHLRHQQLTHSFNHSFIHSSLIHLFMAHLKHKRRLSTMPFSWSPIYSSLLSLKLLQSHAYRCSLHVLDFHSFHTPPTQLLLRSPSWQKPCGQLSEFLLVSDSVSFDRLDRSLLKTLQLSNAIYTLMPLSSHLYLQLCLLLWVLDMSTSFSLHIFTWKSSRNFQWDVSKT